ncbi:MAG: DUF2330 domain-containing protein [Methanocellales archaeon]|nr:DUF2330 domain-containing protein [Methanocellales archaeon]
MYIVPREVHLDESGQNAIIAWNGNEEVIILSTDVKSSESAIVLRILTLPSNPTKVEEGSFDSFTKLIEIINKKVRAIREREMYGVLGKVEAPGVEITFHEKIGAHDITIVKVNDLDYFIDWVKDFTVSKGFEYSEIPSEFKNTISSYLGRNLRYFVFDVIETSETKQTVNPLVYRFKSDFLYYPLEITAFSDVGLSYAHVNIFLIAKGTVNKTIVANAGLWPRTGFDYTIELNKKELEEVSPELGALFKSDPLVMNAYYYGSLNRLNRDLVVYEQDIHIPTFFDKISQSISASLVFRYSSGMWDEITGYAPIWIKILLAIIWL